MEAEPPGIDKQVKCGATVFVRMFVGENFGRCVY